MFGSARLDIPNHPYHVINRAVMCLKIFENDTDRFLFEEIMEAALDNIGMKYCACP
jgi:hypothetical protein